MKWLRPVLWLLGAALLAHADGGEGYIAVAILYVVVGVHELQTAIEGTGEEQPDE